MLLQLESMLDGPFGRITMVKHRIELLLPDPSPVHSAPYQSGPETREFEKAEIDKVLAENVIDPAQTELAARKYSFPKKTELTHFALTILNLTQ